MLAKAWKKIALAICIIAILINVTYKLINKTNIKEELEGVLGTEAISFTSQDVTEDESDDEAESNVQTIVIKGN